MLNCKLTLSILRLEPDILWYRSSKRQRTGRYDSAHRAPTPLSTIRLFFWPGRRLCSGHVLCRLLYPLSKLHVCEEHLPARLQAVGKYSEVFFPVKV